MSPDAKLVFLAILAVVAVLVASGVFWEVTR